MEAELWLRSIVGRSLYVWDQGDRPTCVAVATSVAHSAARTAAPVYAPDALWLHAMKAGAASDAGTTFAAVGAALEDWGQPSVSDWPYELPFTSVDPPVTAGTPPWDTAKLNPATATVDRVVTLVSAGTIPVVIINVHESFYLDSGGARLEKLDPGEAFYGRHAVCVVAHTVVNGDEWFVIQNSWGRDWGIGGYALVSPSYLSATLQELATVEPSSA